MVEQCEKSAERWEIENKTGYFHIAQLNQNDWWSVSASKEAINISERHSKTPYRIVFTMKRTITARPTQPHITPITIAVTSPAEVKHTVPWQMEENLQKNITEPEQFYII